MYDVHTRVLWDLGWLDENIKVLTKKHEFYVPTRSGSDFRIIRKPNEIQKLISDSIEGGLYEQTIIVIGASVGLIAKLIGGCSYTEY